MQLLVPSLTAAVLFAAMLPAQQYAIELTAGTNGGVEVPLHPFLVPPTGLTVEAWIQFHDATMPTGSPHAPTLVVQNAGAQPNWYLRVASGSTNARVLEFAVRDAANTLQVLSYPFAPGQFDNWTHLAATYDGQLMTIHVNGLPVTSQSLASASEIQNAGGLLRIGNGDTSSPGSDTWNGKIDELRIWPMPRQQAEIAAAMNEAIITLPRGIVSFNFDGDFLDSSSGLSGIPFGTVNPFADGNQSLLMIPCLSSEYGPSTTACARSIDISLGSRPSIGNSAFAVWCTKAPVSSPLGMLVIARQQAPVQPPVLGVSLAFTPPSVVAEVLYVPGAFGLGLQRQALPIPNSVRLIGFTVFAQWLFSDVQCGPQGISASNGLCVAVQAP